MVNDASAPVRLAQRRNFRLSAYFSGVCLLGIVTVVIGLAAFQHKTSREALISDQKRTSAAIARAIGNAMWMSYGVVLDRGWQSNAAARHDPTLLDMLRRDVQRLIAGLDVLTVTVVSPTGAILFTSAHDEPETDYGANPAVAEALAGRERGVLEALPSSGRNSASAMPGTIAATYLPLFGAQADTPAAALVVRADVSAAVNALSRRIQHAVVGTAAALIALYLFLLAVVSRAERIHEQHWRALTATEEESRLLAAAMQQSTDAAMIQDLEGRVLRWNKGAERLFGFTAEEAVGRSARALHGAGLSDAEWQQARARMQSDSGYSITVLRRTKDGHDIECEVSVTPVRADDGRRIGHIIIARDMADRRAIEHALTTAKEQAERASAAKSAFLANMSHEIRTPLNAIIGMTELALDCELAPEPRDHICTINAAAGTLLALVNDILDCSKIEAGKLTIEEVELDLRSSIDECIRPLAHGAQERGVELVWSVATEVPDALKGDPVRLRQVLANLVGNAIKFTERGEIEVSVDLVAADEEVCWVHFCVRDTGIGIAADKLSLIFDAFAQADGSTTRRYGGTGLGLTISAHLVESMGGHIAVESEPGQGSHFHFTVRLKRRDSQSQPTQADAPGSLAGTPVLVVDDNATNRQLLARFLSEWSMQVVEAAGGKEAEDAIARLGPGLAIVDSSLPDEDGFALVRRLRAINPHARVVMMTLPARRADAQSWRACGADSSLAKPVSQSDLRQAIQTALTGAPRAVPAPTVQNTSLASNERSLRVLLVEDNAVNRKLAVRLLEKMGHAVVIAGNGLEAVQACAAQTFDVVLMDVQMPVMDGLEATRRIRAAQAPGDGRTPIVAMTANAMQGDRERCLEAGMDGYVTKPVVVATLAGEIDRVVPKAAVTRDLPAVEPDAAVLDAPAALNRLEGDTELFGEILSLFSVDAPPLVEQLRAALAAGDATLVQRLAHTLKGAAANISALALQAAARALEASAREQCREQWPAQLARISTELERLQPVLDEQRRQLLANAA